MIACRGLTKRFGDFTAVDNLTFEVARGTICAFLGPNGAGKSTTLRMLTGLEGPSSGVASICGLDVSKEFGAVKRRIGVLPEDLGLFDDLTVTEHLRLTGELYGLSASETATRIEQLLRVLNLSDGSGTFAAQCSHGMRKKAAFAMALLPNPEVLFLDEPFEAIDPVTSKVMHEVLVKAARRGITVLVTSHILSAVESIADQVMILRGGKLIWNSTAKELPRRLEELYLELVGSPGDEGLEWLGFQRS
jgi:ABC-2 type transport system ATP-binding protein